jgi:hypothetical protein
MLISPLSVQPQLQILIGNQNMHNEQQTQGAKTAADSPFHIFYDLWVVQ